MASFTVLAGTTETTRQDMSGADVGTIQATGSLSVSANAQAIRFQAATSGASIDNSGTIECTAAGGRAIRFESGVGATLNATINNQTSTSVIQSTGDAIQIQSGVTAGTVVINNSGEIESNTGQAIDFADGMGTFVTDVTNNATGIIRALLEDAIVIGGVGDIDNSGTINGGSDAANSEGADGITFEDNTSGTVTNSSASGAISGDRHGINAGTGSTSPSSTMLEPPSRDAMVRASAPTAPPR